MDFEKQIFADMFNFFKANYDAGKDQERWNVLYEQMVGLEVKYKGNPFAMDMLKACTRRLCDLCDKGA